jgi:hypothetical protein
MTMKSAQFIKLLATIRASDDAVGEILTDVGEYILTQWHQHGNKTPANQLRLALHGGVDADGILGEKGETLRGVSATLAAIFAPMLKLGARDPHADIYAIVLERVGLAMRTRAERKADAADSRAKRAAEKARAEKAQERERAAEVRQQVAAAVAATERRVLESFRSCLVMPSGGVTYLTEEEASALFETLQALRAVDTAEVLLKIENAEVIDAA